MHLKTPIKKNEELILVLKLYFGIIFFWTLYRLFFLLPEWIDEFIAKPLIWILPLFFINKKYSIRGPFPSQKQLFKNGLFGLVCGASYFVLYTFLTRYSEGTFFSSSNNFTSVQIFLQGCIALATGFVEEYVFRRFLLERFISIFNDSMNANILTSFLFAFIHLPVILFVYKYPLFESISYLSLLFMSGFIYGLVYLKNKSLTASTLTHAVWNFLGTVVR